LLPESQRFAALRVLPADYGLVVKFSTAFRFVSSIRKVCPASIFTGTSHCNRASPAAAASPSELSQ